MLIYHPAYDAYHCVFRALFLTEKLPLLEVPRLRILDFFLCFPSEVRRVRLPKELAEARKTAQALVNEYHGPVSMQQAFRDMQHIQQAAFRTLAASKIFEPYELEQGMIKRSQLPLPTELKQKIAEAMQNSSKAIDLVVEKLGSLPLQGIDGLKHRTGLMEHRYDIA